MVEREGDDDLELGALDVLRIGVGAKVEALFAAVVDDEGATDRIIEPETRTKRL